MHYLTRHLEALRDLPIGEALVPTGGRFYATEVDADYLVKSKRAAEVGVGQPPVAEARVAAPVPVAVAGPAVEVPPPAVAPQADPPPDEPLEPSSEEAAPPKPRRGRPSNADRLARQATEPADSATEAEAGADTTAASAP